MSQTRQALTIALIGLIGCSKTASEPEGNRSEGQRVESDIPGFVLAASESKFGLGSLQSMNDAGGFVRRTGSWGTLMTSSTGALLGLSNSGSPVLSLSVTMTADAHKNFVRSYYLGKGLPIDQIDAVGINSMMEGHETRGDSPTSGILKSFTTVISRKVPGGVPIVDSMANAACPTSDACSFEIVFWPTIPGVVVSAATDLARLLSDPERAEAYRSKLKTGNKVGNVVIRHSSWRTMPLAAFASYDVLDGNSIRHFDINADEVLLPEEALPPPDESAHFW